MINITELRDIFSMGSLLNDDRSITISYRPSGDVIEECVYNNDRTEFLNLISNSFDFYGTINRGHNISFTAHVKDRTLLTTGCLPIAHGCDAAESSEDLSHRIDVSDFLEATSTKGKSIHQLAYEFLQYIGSSDSPPTIDVLSRYNELFIETRKFSDSVDAVFQHDDPRGSFHGCTIVTFETSTVKPKRKDAINVDLLASVLRFSSELGIEMSVEDGWYSMIFYV